MTIILFLVVLAILIFVHELGHFLVAKKSGIRVDEFAIGFPPKIFSWVKGETKYVLNLIPFGGYVKIFGENPDEESMTGTDSARSFVNAKKWKQVCVLVSGVFFNMLFAWILISISFMFGSPVPVGDSASSDYIKYVNGSQVILTKVMKDSPAQNAGLLRGDKLLEIVSAGKIYGSVGSTSLNTTLVREAIEKSANGQIEVSYTRNGEIKKTNVFATVSTSTDKRMIGISMNDFGIVKFNPILAFWEGGKSTITSFKEVVIGLKTFFADAFMWKADFSQVSGPVGIVDYVGAAASFGFATLLNFIAVISINLAVINLIPFPALDGGRVFFIIIETIIRRPIKPKVANLVNAIGFFILISLMVVITYRDILKLF